VAKETVTIEINERGAREVKRKLEDVGRASTKTGGEVNFLKKALLGIGVGLLAREVFRLADSYANLRNRLRVVTDSEEQLNAVQSRLLSVSNQTRSSLEGNVELFSRLSIATKDLNVSQDRLLALTKSLNQAIALSGATSAEAQAGLIQLSQGLASGALRGDELRSVLEQLPVVGQTIAKGLKTTIGGLRQLGAEGKITAADVIQAFELMREELDQKFGKTVPTVSQRFQVLRNQVGIFVGQLDEGKGGTRLLGDAIELLGNNLETFAKVVLAGVLSKAILLVISQLKLLATVAKSNIAGLLLTGLVAAVSALATFSDQIKVSADGLTTLQDVGLALFDAVKDVFVDLGKLAREFFTALFPQVQGMSSSFLSAFGSILEFAVLTFDNVVKTATGAAAALAVVFGNIPELVGSAAVKTVNVVIDLLNFLFRKVVGTINELRASLEELSGAIPGFRAVFEAIPIPQLENIKDPFVNVFSETGEAAGEAFVAGFEKEAVGERLLRRIRERSAERRAAESQGAAPEQGPVVPAGAGERVRNIVQERVAIDELNKKLAEERDLAKLSNFERQIATELRERELELAKSGVDLKSTENAELRASIEGQIREIAISKERQQLLEEGSLSQDQYNLRLDVLNKRLVEGRINQAQFNEEIRKLNEALGRTPGFLDTIKNKFLEVDTSAHALASSVGDVLVGAIDQLSGAIADLAISGFQDFESFKEALSDILRSIGREILKLVIQFIILRTIQAALGGAGGATQSITDTAGPGSGFTGSSGIALRASGGPAPRGEPMVVGERGPEFFVPQESGSIVPAGKAAGGAEVNLTVVNVTDPNEVRAALSTAEGEQVILNILQKNRKQVQAIAGG
jgi:tape measure domain-containing protein